MAEWWHECCAAAAPHRVRREGRQGEKKPRPQSGQPRSPWGGGLPPVGRRGPAHAPPGAEGVPAPPAGRALPRLSPPRPRPWGRRDWLRGAGRSTGRPAAATRARGRAGGTSGPSRQRFLRLCVRGRGRERTLQLGLCVRDRVRGSLRARGWCAWTSGQPPAGVCVWGQGWERRPPPPPVWAAVVRTATLRWGRVREERGRQPTPTLGVLTCARTADTSGPHPALARPGGGGWGGRPAAGAGAAPWRAGPNGRSRGAGRRPPRAAPVRERPSPARAPGLSRATCAGRPREAGSGAGSAALRAAPLGAELGSPPRGWRRTGRRRPLSSPLRGWGPGPGPAGPPRRPRYLRAGARGGGRWGKFVSVVGCAARRGRSGRAGVSVCSQGSGRRAAG